MESSEEEDDLPSIESITPQSKIDSVHQSLTEKGIRKLCCELLDLKDAVENMCGDMRTKYLAFLRISEEAVEMEHELVELRKHISSQGILVQDLMSGLAREMDEWKRSSGGDADESDNSEDNDPFPNELTDPKSEFLEKIDILLAEHKVDEALEAIDSEERNNPELKGSSGDTSSYKSAFTERKAVLEDQLLRIAKQPSVSVSELKHASNGLIRLGKGPSAHQLLLKHYATSLRRRIEAFLPSCSSCPNTFPATLSKLVFSNISLAAKESTALFGDDDNPAYSNKVVQWAEREVEYLVRLVKENAAPSETVYALRAASVCLQDCLNYCKALEPQGLILSKLFLVLFRPYVEEVLELNFRRARKVIFDLNETDEGLVESSSSGFVAVLSEFAIASDTTMTDCSIRFMQIVQDILEQLTHVAVLHFGESVLARVLQLYDKYIDFLIKALPGHADEDGLPELQDHTILTRAETDSEQLALLGAAFTILDELLPKSLVKVWNLEVENGGGDGGGSPSLISSSAPELKEWKRHMAQSFDKLRNYFCLQFVLSFIYSREGLTRLDSLIYLTETPDDLHLPSLPFQALFSKLQQLAIIAGDVLLGKEKLQKILLARLTETVIIWLSNEQEFWSAFEDESTPLQASGLQQLILDMNFTVEIARFAGYPFKVVQNHASVVINRAINIFSSRGINPQSSLPKAEWFTEAAKSAINRLLMGSDEASEAEEEDEYEREEEEGEGDGHIVLPEIDDDDEHSESLETSSLSTMDSFESFASASMADLESPSFTDSES
ncbi:exocyst complex component EXO84C [Raphanus sativus]|uniref:Exocyst complex component EXO84C n=1 Tax=Raphanus sativus TaxID=3726 RepID=A0A6J0K0I1_RAPSA|nr:exocyst complex component EXO84C [Raphanus sativus]